MKLNWNGVREISERGKEIIERLLKRDGEIALASSFMPRTIAQRMAKINNLTLDYENLLWKGRMTEHYIFRVSRQLLLREELKQRRQLRYVTRLAVASVVVYLLCLFTLVFLVGG